MNHPVLQMETKVGYVRAREDSDAGDGDRAPAVQRG